MNRWRRIGGRASRLLSERGATLVIGAVVVLLCVGPCGEETVADVSSPTVVGVGSDHVILAWPRFAGASEVRVSISPEPPGAGGRLRAQKRVETLPGSARRVRIDDLAPGIDLFVRIEAVGARGGDRASDLHARTSGGPGADLDGPAREVAMVAPNILAITLTGGAGETWQRGPWRVRRRDGVVIGVRRVHRNSVPVAQPGYEVGFGGDDDLSELVVDHRLYLVLAEPVGSPEVLDVTGPGVSLLVPFSDRHLTTPVVQLNQVGYDSDATRRWAYVSWWMGDGGALSLDGFPNAAEVLREPDEPGGERDVVASDLPISRRSVMDRDAGAPVSQIDLASQPASGEARYRIRIPGVGVSYATRVGDEPVREAYRVLARGLFHQRWGGELGRRYTSHPRPSDHPFVYTAERTDPMSFFPADTPRRGRRALRGGYHDAGDFDQRPMHTVVPQLLMRAYEIAPDAFRDGSLGIPESGNDVPDILDEALWGIAAWEQLQERDGGVRAGVESTRHPMGIYFAHEDELDYFTFARDPQVSARAAGLFAQAARLVRPFDAGRARELRSRAERAWRWAQAHDARNEYALYALSELHALTGERGYATEFERRWSSLGPYGAFSNLALRHNQTPDYARGGQVMPDYILGYLRSDGASPAIVELATRWLDQQADRAAAAVLDSPHAHRSPRPAELAPDWGHGTVAGRHLDPVVARLGLGGLPAERRQRYLDALSVAADYVLGANPLGMSFVTGLGERSPLEPCHLDSLAHVKRGRGPVPGIPVYGPVRELPNAAYYRPARDAFHPAFDRHPLMRRYADVHSFVNTNECTVWECQAPHTQHLALLHAL